MSSKFAKQFQVPPEFPEILKDFTREVLRNQPTNINEFAAKYFDCLAQGLPAGAPIGVGGGGGGACFGPNFNDDEDGMSLEEVESIVKDLFKKYDADDSGFLDPSEFKALMVDLQQRLEFPADEIYRFFAEADMNADGEIEYEEFIPLALQIIQSMYAKKNLEHHMAEVRENVEDLLVHGMSKYELTELVETIFERVDTDGSGTLSKEDFVSALTSMELGLTRREINTIRLQIDVNQNGRISYREFVPFAYDLLQKLTSMRLLETELENDELGQYLTDLFKAKDTELSGMLHADDIRDLLHEAMLGLSRMQIYTVISEAEPDPDMMISYPAFIPKGVEIIRSMLSFGQCLEKGSKGTGADAEDQFFAVLDQAFAGVQHQSLANFLVTLERTGLLNTREMLTSRHSRLSEEGDIEIE
jgi:Ca2+-binding EF-hand superfamily protein